METFEIPLFLSPLPPILSHRMDRELIFVLSKTLDPEEKWGIRTARLSNRGTAGIVKISNRETGQKYCSHEFPKNTIIKWLEQKELDDDLCPTCQRKQETNGRAVRLSLGKLEINNDMEEGSGKKKRKKEVEEEGEERTAPPLYIKNAIVEHFEPPKELPKSVKEGTSLFGRGIFAIKKILDKTKIGLYTGTPLFSKKEVKDSKSDKILDITVWDNLVAIDSAKSWSGLINHKWRFPEECEAYYKSNWDNFFANCDVKESGNIVAIRDIKADEELYIDYGMDFWKGKKPPEWQLEGAEKGLFTALEDCDELRKLKEASKIIKHEIIIILD